MSGSSSIKIKRIISSLALFYGEIIWWAGNPDEVMIGAILTQQTRWENVEQALVNLKEQGLCSIDSIAASDIREIEEAIRCTGFYRVKAKRLKLFASYIMDTYDGVAGMAELPTALLRTRLLNISGIGEETADSILCFGLFRTSFVIDTYTDRIVRCSGVTEKRKDLKQIFEGCIPKDNHLYRQTHAHIVEYSKEFCGKKRCSECILVSSNG
jgi:endonuclease III related protein